MYSKIAINNVKRSFKDYLIYFSTLTFGVCIFYSFNAIGSQQVIMSMDNVGSNFFNIQKIFVSVVSIFVSFILSVLIIYANNFLIKKRKKEFGIYMTLGMSKKKISKILILETFLVGLISLFAGLILGVVVSQVLSSFTASLFDVGMQEYKFVVSISAIINTIIYFAIIFTTVMLFNTVIISKYKLIDLLNALKKNEDIKIKSPIVSLIFFIFSLILLGGSYSYVMTKGIEAFSLTLVAIGAIGTFLFFYSLAGVVIYIVQKNKKLYFKDLNIFIVRQINNKINTNFLSMTIVCLMLTIAISMLSISFCLKSTYEDRLSSLAPFDASLSIYGDGGSVKMLEESLNKLNFKFSESSEYVFYEDYEIGSTLMDIIGEFAGGKIKYEIEMGLLHNEVNTMKISQYNAIRELNGDKKIELKDNEVLVISNVEQVVPLVQRLIDKEGTIKIRGKSYDVKNDQVIKDAIESDFMKRNNLTLVLSDEDLKGVPIKNSKFNINFGEKNRKESEEKFVQLIEDFNQDRVDHNKYGFISGITKADIYNIEKGNPAMMIFLGLYLGSIFLISSAVVLALQQLSEASESLERYKALSRIGATESMINKTIFVQTFIYFIVPISLALVHSVVGISVANKYLSMLGKPNIVATSLVTIVIIGAIYGGYFYSTYIGYKKLVKNR